MKTIEEMIAVMTAYKEGKKVEYKPSHTDIDWEYCQDPEWDWQYSDYRIMPEEQKPTYRPYQSAEEILEDMRLHGPMIDEPTNTGFGFMLINEICFDKFHNPICIRLADGTEHDIEGDEYKYMEWQDGTPFGRRVEE